MELLLFFYGQLKYSETVYLYSITKIVSLINCWLFESKNSRWMYIIYQSTYNSFIQKTDKKMDKIWLGPSTDVSAKHFVCNNAKKKSISCQKRVLTYEHFTWYANTINCHFWFQMLKEPWVSFFLTVPEY